MLLECAASGLPLITTDIHGCRKRWNDERAVFYASKRSESLIAAMERSSRSLLRTPSYGTPWKDKNDDRIRQKTGNRSYIKVIQNVIGEARMKVLQNDCRISSFRYCLF